MTLGSGWARPHPYVLPCRTGPGSARLTCVLVVTTRVGSNVWLCSTLAARLQSRYRAGLVSTLLSQTTLVRLRLAQLHPSPLTDWLGSTLKFSLLCSVLLRLTSLVSAGRDPARLHLSGFGSVRPGSTHLGAASLVPALVGLTPPMLGPSAPVPLLWFRPLSARLGPTRGRGGRRRRWK